MFVMKYYVSYHSIPLGAVMNRKVIALVIAKRFGKVIIIIPLTRPMQLRTMIKKELLVFITKKVSKNARDLVLKKLKSN